MRLNQRFDLRGCYQRNITGKRDHAANIPAGEMIDREIDRFGMTGIRMIGNHLKTIITCQFGRSGIPGDKRNIVVAARIGDRAKDILQHRAKERPALTGIEHPGQTLFGRVDILHWDYHPHRLSPLAH